MRDFASFFIDRKAPEKRGVSIKRDIDWWLETLMGHIANSLFLILLGLLAIVIKYFLQVGNSQTIEYINITSKTLITQPADIETILQKNGNNRFFTADLNQISEQLCQLPWIKSAKLTRSWPNTLNIDLQERQASYRWGDHQLMDNHGNRFGQIDNQQFKQLPKLWGQDGHEQEVISAYRQLIAQLGQDSDQLAIEKFILNKYLSWELHLQSGVVIKLGRDNYSERMSRFASAFKAQKLPDFKQLDALDFRYHHDFVAKWKPEFSPLTKDKLLKVYDDRAIGI